MSALKFKSKIEVPGIESKQLRVGDEASGYVNVEKKYKSMDLQYTQDDMVNATILTDKNFDTYLGVDKINSPSTILTKVLKGHAEDRLGTQL